MINMKKMNNKVRKVILQQIDKPVGSLLVAIQYIHVISILTKVVMN